MGRDRSIQAVLPLRGKILNVEKAQDDRMLNNQEIATLIKALGTGIGEEFFDPDKLRYHKIILMCDADVDGSHIRTLLLTFFYRQMKPLLDKGHLYIAQPPLYRVKKGKRQEIYCKDERRLEEALFRLGCEEMTLEYKDKDGVTSEIHGDDLIYFAQWLRMSPAMQAALQSLWETLPSDALPERLWKDSDALQLWLDSASASLQRRSLASSEEALFSTEIADSGEGSAQPLREILCEIKRQDLIIASERVGYDALLRWKEAAHTSANSSSFSLIAGNGTRLSLSTLHEIAERILEVGKKGCDIQRYKGLGEMNPIQLWDTTMNPKTRTLLKVRLKNHDDAELVFTELMGEQVEPRRNFIERNALQVRNLDT